MKTRYYMTCEVRTEQGHKLVRTEVDRPCYYAWRSGTSDLWYDYMPKNQEVIAVVDVEKEII